MPTLLATRLPTGFKVFGITITYYAIFILIGALLALFLAAYEARRKGYTWDYFTAIFVIAFPSGIVGARLWYVIAQWETEFGFADFGKVFRIWDGGLAIQGGALLGIAAGMLAIHYLRRGSKVLEAVDYAVVGILVAQAIGRIGNFFNHEVYGMLVNRSSWSFLPSFILNQMQESMSVPDLINVPLFLVEGIINLCGYFIIQNLIKPLMKDKFKYGDAACLYIMYYGIVRAVMEPMRNPDFIMGSKTQASFVMAVLFIGVGAMLLIFNHLYPNLKNMFKKKNLK